MEGNSIDSVGCPLTTDGLFKSVNVVPGQDCEYSRIEFQSLRAGSRIHCDQVTVYPVVDRGLCQSLRAGNRTHCDQVAEWCALGGSSYHR